MSNNNTNIQHTPGSTVEGTKKNSTNNSKNGKTREQLDRTKLPSPTDQNREANRKTETTQLQKTNKENGGTKKPNQVEPIRKEKPEFNPNNPKAGYEKPNVMDRKNNK